jgi:hypothetical protein
VRDAPLVILSAVMRDPTLLEAIPDGIDLGRMAHVIEAVRRIVERGGAVSVLTVQETAGALGPLAADILTADESRADPADFNAAVSELEHRHRHRRMRELAEAGDERGLRDLLDAPKSGALRWKPDNPDDYRREPPPRDWRLVDMRRSGGESGLLGGTLALLVAPGGTGKSLALAQLAVAYASRTPWLETFDPKPREGEGRVLWIAAEDGEAEVRHRKWQAWHAVSREHVETGAGRVLSGGISSEVTRNIMTITARRAGELALVECDARGKPSSTRLAMELRRMVCGEGIDLVLVDPLSRVIAGGDENDNTRQTFVAMALEDLGRDTGALVVAAHHERKGGKGSEGGDADMARGGSALVDAARFAFRLEKDPHQDDATGHDGKRDVPDGKGGFQRAVVWSHSKRTLRAVKCNNGARPTDLKLEIRSPGILVIPDERRSAAGSLDVDD